jgi:REP element-mobilizing transposase RayT
VRRAFLCGDDHLTGKSFEHRKGWIEARLIELAQIFAIDLCAYAVMSNHYHVVLHVNREQAQQLTNDEVIERWQRLFNGTLLIHRYQQNKLTTKAERDLAKEVISHWRERLMDISWFMRCINEPIAREANKEDQATGRFWEGRFKSQALLDESALIACMAYVDLNPIRAGMAKTPEDSAFTSIHVRAKQAQSQPQPNYFRSQVKQLYPFAGNPRQAMPEGLPFKLTDYMELVDWTGRILREDKKGRIPEYIPPILQRLNIDPDNWCYLSNHFESPFKHWVGAAHRVRSACEQLGQNWVHGIKQCERLFSSS